MTFFPIWERLRRASGRAAAVVALALMAGAATVNAGAAQEHVLTVGNPFAPLSLDPALSGNGRAGTWLLPAYEPLVRTRADGSFEPALATAWEVAPDSKSVVFTLREGVTFSDGAAMDAAAVKKSIEYFVGRKGPFAGNLASLQSVEVLGDHQVRISLSAPNPNIVNMFDQNWNVGAIISPKAIDAPETLLTGTYGAGPYKLDPGATVTGTSYVYVPNEAYYDKARVKWDEIKISVFLDQNSGVQAMRAGQLDLLVSDPFTANSNVNSLGDTIRVVHSPMQWAGIVLMDRTGEINKALGDLRVRQALNMGIDRDLVAQAMFGRFAAGTGQLQVKGFQGYDPALEKIYPFDVDRAKALLAEAGHADGLEIKVGYVNNTLNAALFQAYADQLSQIGVTLTPVPFQGIGPSLAARQQRTIETLLFNTNSGVPNLAKFQTLMPGGSLNPYGPQDPALTALIEKASATPAAEAEPAWQAVYRWVAEQAWFLPVIAVDAVYFATDRIKTPEEIGQSIIFDLIWVEPAQ